jgi:ribokinase
MDLVARVPHIPVPGETVLGTALARHHGGKGGNQAVAAARLGAAVSFHGAVGDDGFGSELAAALAAEGIATGGLLRVPGPSGCALINVGDDGENAISVLPGANEHAPLPPAAWPAPWRALLLQLETPLPTVLAWAQAAHAAGVPVWLNAAPMCPLPPALLPQLDLLVVNESELALLCGGEVAAAATLGPRRVVVTLGARGAVAWDAGRRIEQAAHDVWVVDSTGAGDSFVGALAAALWQGRPFDEALHRAGVAAALACARLGARAGMPTAAELEAEILAE